MHENNIYLHPLLNLLQTIRGKSGIGDYLIDEDSWECIWNELLVNKKGVKTFLDREGLEKRNYNFSVEFLNHMIAQYDRLINKYGGDPLYNWRTTSQDLVELLTEHRQSLIVEVEEVENGTRVLSEKDFLGPETRLKMKLQKLVEQGLDFDISDETRSLNRRDSDVDYFTQLEKHLLDRRRNRNKEEIIKAEEERLRKKSRKLK